MAAVGKHIWMLMEKKSVLWVKRVNGVYMNGEGEEFWTDNPAADCSWYWKALNKLKSKMISWYEDGHYCLSSNGKHSISLSYMKLIGETPRVEVA